MSQPSRPSAKDEQRLMADLWSPEISENPLNFVLYAYPWGKVNTPLWEHKKGPKDWQREEFEQIRVHIQANKRLMSEGKQPLLYQSATASGRGVGKSADVAWIISWMMSCQIGSTTICTANTEDQLKTKTWAELGKWHTLSINNHWFDRTALSFHPHPWFDEALKRQLKVDTGYYYAKAQLWSEEKPDSFAGAHNFAGMLVLYDEASGIPKPIWTVTEGFFTEPILHRYWFCFSNPRRNTGSFFECFHKQRAFWHHRNLDSRDVEGTDLNVLNQIVAKYGDDSDETRIEVKGQFPRQGDHQFVSRDLVDSAVERDLESDDWAALILGVDPARFGSAKAVCRFRQGRNARVIPPREFKGLDNMQLALEVAYLIDTYHPDAVCIDMGNGTGVIDRLRELGYLIHEVTFGAASPTRGYQNFRTHIWALMREWLQGGMVDDHQDLLDDLVGPIYKFVGASDVIRLETKEEMTARGLASPDHGDALACTFAVRVPRRDNRLSRNNPVRSRTAHGSEKNNLD